MMTYLQSLSSPSKSFLLIQVTPTNADWLKSYGPALFAAQTLLIDRKSLASTLARTLQPSWCKRGTVQEVKK